MHLNKNLSNFQGHLWIFPLVKKNDIRLIIFENNRLLEKKNNRASLMPCPLLFIIYGFSARVYRITCCPVYSHWMAICLIFYFVYGHECCDRFFTLKQRQKIVLLNAAPNLVDSLTDRSIMHMLKILVLAAALWTIILLRIRSETLSI